MPAATRIRHIVTVGLHNKGNNKLQESAMQESARPIHTIRYGNVSCAVWANNSSSGYFYNTTITRVYRDGDDWGESGSFDDRDLTNVMKAAADAHTWIHLQKSNATTVGKTE